MHERYVEVCVALKTGGTQVIFRGKSSAQAYSACSNYGVKRTRSGRYFQGLRAWVADSVTSQTKQLGWLVKEGESLC